MKTAKILMIATALLVPGWATACRTAAPAEKIVVNQPPNQTNNNNQSETKKTVYEDQREDVKTETIKSSDDLLTSPTQAYKIAYTARQKKDLVGLKRVLSKDMLGFFAMIGESEKKNIDEELTQLAEQPQALTNESRNEKITGDTATLEYPDAQGKWKTMDFVKEDGEWKLSFPDTQSPVIENTIRKQK